METGFTRLRLLLNGIYIYHQVLRDPVVRSFTRLLDGLAEDKAAEVVLRRYAEFIGNLAAVAELGTGRITGDAWVEHIIHLVMEDENTFTRKAEYVSFQEMSPGLLELARHDLTVLRRLAGCGIKELREMTNRLGAYAVDAEIPLVEGKLVFHSLFTESSECQAKGGQDDPRNKVKEALLSSADWGQCLELLAGHAREYGCGIFRKYLAFRWVRGADLTGIPCPDPVRLSDLIGYERQKYEVVENTRRFVQGLPANNVLLYGDRGTGKSSTVKALIHEFGRKGLRLVEVGRESFAQFPEVLSLLRTRPQRFIIFIDDLSFEEYETEYKDLKAVMEGGIQPQPENVLIYATSNRKHLVKETLKDRSGAGLTPEGEIHPGDTLEEKISLADRFGIVVTFPRPDLKTYLHIVEGLAEKEGILMDKEELHSLALKWEVLHNGRSGRTARQFIQDLLGQDKPCRG